ncbi:MAG: NADP-dependent oxidoreductase [Rhodopseudomonas palustris]|uniref:NADP-dependent oxidoreductase n=1 Tax=Rhodopseudomonas palustris TaxID=1076 RepID=A0A933W0H5_RHOPL|nr:NADP-dependent oxidoreductase [Rhodopseudomonas palustris]
MNRQWQLARRPAAEPTVDDFKFATLDRPELRAADDVLIRNRFLSLDPYMRWRMNDAKSYAPPIGLGEVMVGATVGEVVASNDSGFGPGDLVVAGGGWQDYAIVKAPALRKCDAAEVGPTAYLGVLGSPGFTAYAGLMKIGEPKPGETVVVGAATGGVGSLVVQLAKSAGCRVVAVAGGAKKCALAVERFGADAAVDHRDPDLAQQLAAACPNGIDVYFENIGGRVLDAVIPLLNPFARVPVCGLISQYNSAKPDTNQTPLARLMQDTLVKRLLVRGFIVTDYLAYRDEFLAEVTPKVRSGAVVFMEDIVDGLEQAPAAFIGLLKGQNTGKLIIRID